MPLCTRANWSCEIRGCALCSEGTPCVAHRVCAMPVVPCRLEDISALSSSLTLPGERKRNNVLFESRTASPAESYPRYSSLFNPLIRIFSMLRSETAPTIPHILYFLFFFCWTLPVCNTALLAATKCQL